MTSSNSRAPENLHGLKVSVTHEGKLLKQESGKLQVTGGTVELKKFLGRQALFKVEDVTSLEHRASKLTLRTRDSFWVFEFPGKKDEQLRQAKDSFASGFGLNITGNPKTFVLEKEHIGAGAILLIAVIATAAGSGGSISLPGEEGNDSTPKDGMVTIDKKGVVRKGAPRTNNQGANLAEALNNAVTDSNGQRLKALVKTHPEVLTLTTIGGCDTALHAAAMVGEVRNARFLLSKGAPVDTRGCFKNTPLHIATGYCNRPDVVDLLLQNGADPNASGDTGNRPLHTAAADGCLPLVKRLVKAGAKVNAKNDLDETPFSHATGAVVSYLKSLGGKE
jgi:hypothetical protein